MPTSAPNYTDKQHREVFHLLFLERLLKISDPRFYALKGGVNLRFFFRSPRYSEDMDLDVFGGSVETLRKNGYKILRDASFLRILQTYGIEKLILNDSAKAKQSETTQRFRFRLVNSNGEAFPTKVEFSRRRSLELSQVETALIVPEVIQPYKKLSFACQHYHSDYAILQKVQALGGRVETQARDVFDLYILYLAGSIRPDLIRTLTTLKERECAIVCLLGLNYESYTGQVVEYLEPDGKLRFGSEKAWNDIAGTILELLDAAD
jgi:predicted nucleotidyltransferase component of viral defense system